MYGNIDLSSKGVALTRGVIRMISNSVEYRNIVYESVRRFVNHDWGDVDAEDKALNDHNMHSGICYAIGSYQAGETKFWVMVDDSGTITVLLPDEY